MIRHDHISANADAKVSRSSTIFDKRLVYLGLRKEARTSVSVERHEIDWRIRSLEH